MKSSRVFNLTCVVVRSELLRSSLWVLSIVIVWFALAWLGAGCGCLLLSSVVVSPARQAAADLMIDATLVWGVMTCTARHRTTGNVGQANYHESSLSLSYCLSVFCHINVTFVIVFTLMNVY